MLNHILLLSETRAPLQIYCNARLYEEAGATLNPATWDEFLDNCEKLKRSAIRKGQVLVDPALAPVAVREFTAEVLILHHPTTIHAGYHPVVHARTVRVSLRQ